MDRDIDSEALIGPWYQRTEEVDEQLPSAMVATMWLCMLKGLEPEHLEALQECNMAVAFDLGIAAQVASDDQVPLAAMLAEVFEFYNERLCLSLPSMTLGERVALHYQMADTAQSQLH
ncbi:hypothetical protein [Ferrimonas gelatinilytica]|uniref:Uncharacterized protein n=1 Tax=Ferrimonas gelatinilytica TaxID=1255257 RepID=A0ABP9RY08_9GAMM